VRELEHTLMRGALRASRGDHKATVLIDVTHLGLDRAAPPPPSAESSAVRLREAVDDFTRDLIKSTVSRCDGNWAQAARKLGLQRGNLHRLATRLQLHDRRA
jgi:anaerobic nitric oxide reductase transcription regulator